MFQTNIQTHFSKVEKQNHNQNRPVSLTPGQIIQGKVVKLFPNNIASLQINGIQLTGVLEAPLTAGERYWFEVKESKGLPHLQVLDAKSSKTTGQPQAASVERLLQQLGLANVKMAEAFTSFLTKQNINFSKQTIVTGSQLLGQLPNTEEGLPIIAEMIKKNLPLTKEIFDAIRAVTNGPSLSSQVQGLAGLLETSTNTVARDIHQQLNQIVKEMVIQPVTGSNQLPEQVRTMIQMLGYSHENGLMEHVQGTRTETTSQSETLKALLLQMQQQELPLNVKESASQLLHRLTGQQLLSHDQIGSLHTWLVQLPIQLGSFHTDLAIQWEGKNNTENQLDPSFCRILFYLTLERLKDMVVDVHIQNRILSVTIFNETQKPQALLDVLTPILKKSLHEQEYELLSVMWKPLKAAVQKQHQPYQQKASYQGVDIRV
ncbi:hypothetical protein [Bacillus suaedae]|uniref:Flagellar hook-length control protein FliK n=1 Tax=Halalkalibacter suaedae TaxID=2822140 RepID=A0A940WSR2_9BACI|nr:hypothetical protein [Bacillus suaedae]MBP3952054.1 hypothetical protein [Bacillus suaedae]